jgi:hypothetical protein
MNICWGVALALAAGAADAQTPPGSARDDLTAQAGEARASSREEAPAARPAWRYGVDGLLLEAGSLPDAPEADRTATLRGTAFVLWQPDRSWELRAGALLYGVTQQGGAADYTDWSADVADTYVRWRSGDTRLTLGAQTVLWGRVDEVPLIDRVSRVDLTRFVLDDLPDRRRAQFALRWEQTWYDIKLDAVALPAFRGAALPDTRSVWSPVNVTTGEIIGIAPTPQLAALVRSATIREDDGGSGGAALRLTRAGESFDAGLTLARTRQSIPYYRVDLAAPSLTAIHPYNNFAGVDAEWVTGGITWRTELGYIDGVPATLPNAAMTMVDAVEWVGAMEFFPGGEDTRVNLQLLARSLRTSQTILEIENYVGVNGEVETSFVQGRWKAGVRFALGLNVRDTYVAPKLAFVGSEPHELYLVAHVFSGEERTLGGFHRNHDMIAVGLRTRF